MRSEQATAVKAGIFVVFCLALLVFMVVLLGQRNQLFAAQYTLTVYFSNAGGIIPGADVRLAGVGVGRVRHVEIITDANGTRRVRVDLDIAQANQPMITEDSLASIRTLGPLGDKYVEITLGSPDTKPLPAKAVLRVEEGEDFYEIARKARVVLERANRIAEQVTNALDAFNESKVTGELGAGAQSFRRVAEATEKGPGLLHSVIYDEKLPQTLEDMRVAAASLRASIQALADQKGLLGQLIHDESGRKALNDFGALVGSGRNVASEIEQGQGALHALIYEPQERAAIRDFGQVLAKLNRIMSDVQEGKGTLGLLIYDPEVWETFKRLLGSAEESRVLKYLIQRYGVEEPNPTSAEAQKPSGTPAP